MTFIEVNLSLEISFADEAEKETGSPIAIVLTLSFKFLEKNDFYFFLIF